MKLWIEVADVPASFHKFLKGPFLRYKIRLIVHKPTDTAVGLVSASVE